MNYLLGAHLGIFDSIRCNRLSKIIDEAQPGTRVEFVCDSSRYNHYVPPDERNAPNLALDLQ